ncbi:unnamed protein product [Orchesella dallaii]|uniref:Ionotropic glutamate receptor C-terminal domain-containing protein n=1 Tax=Orchesella dallaii TaxID=48710 RepID=A0ABP1RMR0_9HEXA
MKLQSRKLTLNILLVVHAICFVYGYKPLRNNALQPSLPMPNERLPFFKNFYHCLFQFHTSNISSEQQIAWTVYDPLLNYYGGISPFTIQSSIVSKSIKDSERYQSHHKNRGSIRRHSNCSIQLQLICQDIRDGTAIWRNEFVWYIFSTTRTGTKCVGKFPTDIPLQSYSSLYFGISNFRRIFMLCWSCLPILTSLPKDNAMNTIIGYLYLWKKLHRNLNEVLVGINDDLILENSISRWSCNIHKIYVVPVHTCVYFTMWKALNFTNINTHSPITHELYSHTEGLIFSRVPVTRSTTKMVLSENLEFISYAWHIQPYSSLMVVEQVSINWQAIIQPFDAYTWIFLLVAINIVGLVLCLELTTWYAKLCKVEFQITLLSASHSWFKVEFATVALLIRQSVPIGQFMNKSPKSLFVLWCFWSFVAVTLSQFYEGSMFSFLSTTVSPLVPQTLDEVLRTNTLMFTQTSGQKFVGGTPTNKYSILKESVLSEMIENDRKKNDSAYGELYRKIKFIWIGYNVNTTLEFQKNGWIINTLSGVAIKVPHTFFLVDTVAQVTFFRAYLSIITQKWLSKPVSLPTLVSRHGWVIKRNYMYETLKRKLAQLYESGLYVRWDVFCMDSEIVTSVMQSIAALGLRNLKNGVSASNLFQYVFCSEQIQSAVAEEIAIGIDMLAILFMYSAFHASNTSRKLRESWELYSPLLNYYAGVSPFTIETSIPSKSEKYGNKTNKYYFIRRHSNCSVQLQLICQEMRDSTIAWKTEFIWFIFSSIGIKCVGKFAADLPLQTHSSLYFSIYNFQYIFMICWSCRPVAIRITTAVENTICGYRNLWEELHQNLNGVLVGISFEMKVPRSILKWDCNIHKDYTLSVATCGYFTMWKTLNLTIYSLKSPNSRSIYVHGLLHSQAPVAKITAEWIAFNNFELLNYAMHFQPFYYLMVLENIPTNWQAITQPFDWLTWISLLATTYIVALVLCLEFKTWDVNLFDIKFQIQFPTPMKSPFSAGFATVSLLVNQFHSISQFLKKSPASLFLCWSFWSFGAVTLSQFYEGTLFSFLTTIVSPPVPNTLEGVVETNSFMFTQTTVQDNLNGTATNSFSFLRDSILYDMLENYPESNDSVYSELHRRLKWIWVGLNQDTTLELLTNGWIINSLNGKAFKFPDKFFFIDDSIRVNLFRTYLSLVTQKWISTPLPLHIFVGRFGWVIKQNYMYERFKMKFAQLYESGIYVRWDLFFVKSDIAYDVKQAVGNVKLIPGRNGITTSNLFHYVYCGEQKPSENVEELPIGLDIVSTVLLYAGVCIIFSVIIFIHEIMKPSVP